jgi:hypothetical protein
MKWEKQLSLIKQIKQMGMNMKVPYIPYLSVHM